MERRRRKELGSFEGGGRIVGGRIDQSERLRMRYAPARDHTPKSPVAAAPTKKCPPINIQTVLLKCHYPKTVKANAQVKMKDAPLFPPTELHL
ncbi:hypothetical protein TNCV_169261 [Trichonephila clavipes]|nr:hypothetical protein TNCV_169261 [Trichonephila clavipes]